MENESENSFISGQTRYIHMQISIIDSGVGISTENIEKLFVNFSKLEETNDINKGGTGLGLSICKLILEQMGGSINIKSEIGVGTKFTLNIKTKCQVNKPKLKEELINKFLNEKYTEIFPEI